mgnify:FL=1
MRRGQRLASAAAAAALLAAGCADTVTGRPVSVFADPFRVAGMPAVDGPTGLRPDAAAPTREAIGTDHGEMDRLATAGVSDIEQYWTEAFPQAFDGRTLSPVTALVSWDATGMPRVFCDELTFGLVNAAYCYDDRTIGWDRGELLPSLRDQHGEMAVVMVLAHEYGHAVSRQARLSTRRTGTLISEQQADCFAGAYLRWVTEGNSPRFTLNTGDGLNNVLAAVIAFRDPLFAEDDLGAGLDEHGSAFERLSAFQAGFTDGPPACAAIDAEEIEQRRGDLPVLLQAHETGELPVTEQSVREIVAALGVLFEPAEPPRLRFTGASAGCPDARPSPPVSYCPATNTLSVDVAGLADLATAHTADAALATGDNGAYSVLISRYMLALQREHGGVALDTAAAALRTACLTGVATTRLSAPDTDGVEVRLTAGDVDEAVSGILTNGLAAGDVNGETVPSGFSRIEAFRLGVLGDADRCYRRFG